MLIVVRKAIQYQSKM